MKPILIIPPDCMSAEDIAALNKNDICTVVCKDPAAVKFVDPIPAISSRSEIENAAIKLSRRIMGTNYWRDNNCEARTSIIKTFVEILAQGTPIDPNELPQEREKRIFDYEKSEEMRRLARIEAKQEREAAKKAKS